MVDLAYTQHLACSPQGKTTCWASPTAVQAHLAFIAQQPEGHWVGYAEGKEAEVEGCLVKCKVNAAVGPSWGVVHALPEQGYARALPAHTNKRTKLSAAAVMQGARLLCTEAMTPHLFAVNTSYHNMP
jgi:hypothetical protein